MNSRAWTWTRLRSIAALVAAMAAVGTAPLVAQAPPSTRPAPRDVKRYTIEQFMDTVRIGGASFSPDDAEILFSSNQNGIFNVYALPVAGGKPRQVTDKKETTQAISFFPKDRRILFTHDRGGNELNHLYVLEEDGTERDLTPGEKLRASFGGWTDDRTAFYVVTNERDQRFMDIYRYDAKTYERTMFYENTDGYLPGPISRDEKWIALVKVATQVDNDVYLYNRDTRQVTHITPHTGEASFRPADFDPTSGSLYMLSNADGEFMQVVRYDLASGKTEPVEGAKWDAMYTYFSRTGRYRVVAYNEDARTVITIRDTKTGEPLPLPRLPAGDITGVRISDSEKLMAFYLNGDRSPSNLYVYDMDSRQARKLTDTLNPAIDPDHLVESEVVRYPSFDDLTIPALLYKPHDASTSRVPALVMVHGGPGGQARKGYSAVVQFLVNHGYAVLDINNRGSSGYGKTFLAADDGRHGREPLWDTVEAKKYLQSLPWVDGDRIGIMGGSYGGYMVLSALAFKPDVFDAGVNIFGVSNWIRTLKVMPAWWEAQRRALYKEIGDPEKDEERLRAVSPLFHASNIVKPLIVLQGANDPRVIKPESDDIVEAVKKNGVPVEYVVFEDEGHGFTKRDNEIRAYRSILQFLDTHLKGKKPRTGTAPED